MASQSQQQSTNIGSSTGSGSMSIGVKSTQSEGFPPLWRFVTRFEKQGEVGEA